MKIDGETGTQLLLTVGVILVVLALVFRVNKKIRSLVTGLPATL